MYKTKNKLSKIPEKGDYIELDKNCKLYSDKGLKFFIQYKVDFF